MSINGLTIIGESINDSVPSTQKLFDAGDIAGLKALARHRKRKAPMLALADERDAQVILEAWMPSKYTPLISECVGCDINFDGFDPWANLRDLRRLHPERKLYLSMILGPKSLRQAEEMIVEAGRDGNRRREEEEVTAEGDEDAERKERVERKDRKTSLRGLQQFKQHQLLNECSPWQSLCNRIFMTI